MFENLNSTFESNPVQTRDVSGDKPNALTGASGGGCSEMDPDEVRENLKRTFRGKTVGFCCPPCLDAWDELSEEEKADKLEEGRGGE